MDGADDIENFVGGLVVAIKVGIRIGEFVGATVAIVVVGRIDVSLEVGATLGDFVSAVVAVIVVWGIDVTVRVGATLGEFVGTVVMFVAVGEIDVSVRDGAPLGVVGRLIVPVAVEMGTAAKPVVEVGVTADVGNAAATTSSKFPPRVLQSI